ncbi:MAG: hypothetical protein KTR14_09835 [Vampirovibrio sp.]|nr:hypothetical protein [Vampirovibrio sp.]
MKHLNFINKVLNFSAERYFRAAGDLFIYDGDYEAALYMIDRALEQEPDNTRAMVLKGDILFCLNKDLEALNLFNQALEFNPHYVEAYISKAGVLDVMNKPRKALECCNKAFQLLETHNRFLLPSLYDQKLVLLIRMKRFREAQKLLNMSRQHLEREEYNYLCGCYRKLLDGFCQKRRQSTSTTRPQDRALQIVTGTNIR